MISRPGVERKSLNLNRRPEAIRPQSKAIAKWQEAEEEEEEEVALKRPAAVPGSVVLGSSVAV